MNNDWEIAVTIIAAMIIFGFINWYEASQNSILVQKAIEQHCSQVVENGQILWKCPGDWK